MLILKRRLEQLREIVHDLEVLAFAFSAWAWSSPLLGNLESASVSMNPSRGALATKARPALPARHSLPCQLDNDWRPLQIRDRPAYML
jgi:hypothetical protein